MNAPEPIDHMLTAWMRQAFAKAFPDAGIDLAGISVVPAGSPEFGDYQCNGAMALARILKKPPKVIAETVTAGLPLHESLEHVTVAGQGFLNLFLNAEWLARHVERLAADARLGVPRTGEGRTIVMDYGGPNITKPLHIGHLRSPNIGSAIDKMHRLLGYHVIADSHLGDWGTQFGITILGYRHFGDAEAMAREPMEELERVYVKSYEKSRQDEAWLNQCRQELVKLQAGDPENLKLWKQFVDLSMRELDKIYTRLGVKFDLVRGESYYNDRLVPTIELLGQRGLVKESEGALVVDLEPEKLPVCIVRKRDGGFNYATTDLATVIARVEEFHPDKILYLTDERQQLHFKQVFATCRRLGVTVELEHIWFGLMRLPEGTFSTRHGNVIKLDLLLDEAEERALALVKESSPEMPPEQQKEVARAVGIGAVKYADLSQNPQSLVTFTWDKAMALNGNSAPYLQYAHARIASVLDKYRERFPQGSIEASPIRLVEPVERALALAISRFPEAVVRAADGCRPSHLADYLYNLAGCYSTFYQNVPFLQAPEGIRESRIRLGSSVATILKAGLGLLGIETPDRI